MYKQVKFVYDGEVLGGIAKIDEETSEIKYVICGCCGCVFDPNEIYIIRIYSNWANFADYILDNDVTNS